METIDESQSPRLTQSATWTLRGSSWWIRVEVERHLRDDVARALEADLHALGFVLSLAPALAPLSAEECVDEASGYGWSARCGTLASLTSLDLGPLVGELADHASARLQRLGDILGAWDVETFE